ncbi:MAG: class I SAM-dependent methyltransferase [Elusimicrobiales bacterium]|nr:class I SAM-dependent methyltransferase [Elusimicrobiales bacterium]
MKASPDWHKGFFRNSFYNPASPAALVKAPAEAAFALKQLKLKKGAALLDLCCGPGRHAVEFAKRGLLVTGYDFSQEYLREAAARARRARVKAEFLRGDMRALGFRARFDAAVNLFTSFGYFTRFSDDLKTLKGVAAALKPGGLFLIDIVNGDFLEKNFCSRDWADMGGYYLLEERARLAGGIVNRWTRVPKKGGRPASRTFYTRLYGRASLGAALRKAGFSPLRFWGGFTGGPLRANSPRLLCLARKA